MIHQERATTTRGAHGSTYPVGEARLEGDTLRLTLRGGLCMEAGSRLRGVIQAVRGRAGNHRTLLVDLRELEVIDSFGVESLVQAEADVASEGGRVVLVPGPPHVQRAFRLLGCEAAFEIAPNPETDRPASRA